MKEATGELNMTVVTLVAIAAIGALFYAFVWPMIQRSIATQTCQTYGTNYKAYTEEESSGKKCEGTASTGETTDNAQAKTEKWICCEEDN